MLEHMAMTMHARTHDHTHCPGFTCQHPAASLGQVASGGGAGRATPMAPVAEKGIFMGALCGLPKTGACDTANKERVRTLTEDAGTGQQTRKGCER